jgi:hypothetical protein
MDKNDQKWIQRKVRVTDQRWFGESRNKNDKLVAAMVFRRKYCAARCVCALSRLDKLRSLLVLNANRVSEWQKNEFGAREKSDAPIERA